MSGNGLKPREIVEKLDRHIIGQVDAKRAVAIALRNRWRRQNVPKDLADEISPKNIIMIGPTGVGKTEIARRLAKLDNSPFLKIEASKFTEVGYVGRDVESMIRDLVELSLNMVKSEEQENVRTRASQIAEEKLLDLLLPPRLKEKMVSDMLNNTGETDENDQAAGDQGHKPDATREKLRHCSGRSTKQAVSKSGSYRNQKRSHGRDILRGGNGEYGAQYQRCFRRRVSAEKENQER